MKGGHYYRKIFVPGPLFPKKGEENKVEERIIEILSSTGLAPARKEDGCPSVVIINAWTRTKGAASFLR